MREVKNVLILLDDALRRDFLSVYGYTFYTTPNLKKLLKNAYIFSSAYTCSSWTGTVVASIFSGLHPSEHGHFRELQIFSGPIRINDNKNYYNFCLSANPWLEKRFGFGKGWEEHFISDRLSGEGLIKRAKDIIGNLKCPFLGYLHFMENHEPFDDCWHLAKSLIDLKQAEKRYKFMLDSNSRIVRLSDGLCRFLYKKSSRRSRALRKKFLRYQSERSRQFTNLINYISCVYKFDYLVGDLIDFLKEKNILKETVLILTSDHGEGFGNRDGIDNRHGYSLYEETLRIPLIIYNTDFESRIIKRRFSICDLLQLVKNIQAGESDFLEDSMFRNENIAILKRTKDIKIGVILQGRNKLIKNYASGVEEGFNLDQDPYEKTSIFNLEEDRFLMLREKLDKEMDKADKNENDEEVVLSGRGRRTRTRR